MKYFLSIIVTLLVSLSFFSNISNVSAGWITINHGGGGEIPYCNDGEECGLDKGVEAIKNINVIETEKTASQYVQDLVIFILGFLMLLSIGLIIYSGIVLLTGVGDEEKAKKTKQIIIYAILGLIIVFLAYPISNFVFDALSSQGNV